jgi:hypothetical protein
MDSTPTAGVASNVAAVGAGMAESVRAGDGVFFNSYPLVFVFLPLVLLGFALLIRRGTRGGGLAFLIVASLVFYACGTGGS